MTPRSGPREPSPVPPEPGKTDPIPPEMPAGDPAPEDMPTPVPHPTGRRRQSPDSIPSPHR